LSTELSSREFLSRAHYIDQRIEAKRDQAARLRARATNYAALLTGMPKAATPNPQTMESMIARTLDLEQEILDDITELIAVRKEVKAVIGSVDKIELQSILDFRYLSYLDWKEIAAAMGFNDRHVFKLHTRALEVVDRIRRTA